MKTTITFEFNEDDQEDKLHRLVHADEAYYALHSIVEYLRTQYKYNDEAPTEYLEALRNHVGDIIEEAGIDLERDYP